MRTRSTLSRTDRLDEDDVLPRRIEQENRLKRRLREPAEVSSRPHRANVDPGIEEVVGEPNPVSEQRPTGERARGIDRDDTDRRTRLTHVRDERRDEARLADSRRSGDADDGCPSRVRIELPDEPKGQRVPVLHERDRAGERPAVGSAHAFDELSKRPLLAGHGRTLCGVREWSQRIPDLRSASRIRRASISSSSVAIRSRPLDRLPFAAGNGAGSGSDSREGSGSGPESRAFV